ncbi:tRNA wybutosine-synthesizing protein 3 homolog [Periophthalmus magnuspinnatus]|uniref:tRNA wybutosine-synthesizing protein 3 homolog n=1 Tax=Periophthalmus magnuspinnatus TaxID=409849 RepID=UPI00145B6148|nr:tRNA wybutosine-synthesizing protein 3 homolog [Periophthalmus magnuspinnatus]
MSCTDREFERWKRQNEQRMDQSKKGGVDEDIAGLVRLLNGTEQYFTTSSCSGRVILIDGSAESSDVQKQNCQWLFVSHQKCTTEQLTEAVDRSSGDAVLKFEPFVLHVQCRRLYDAQLLHSVAINSGFRNSGLTVGKTGKIISAIRSTHGLEVPLTHQGTLLVTPDYIQFLCQICNQKMEENLRRIHRFTENLQKALAAADIPRLHVPECLSAQPPQSLNGDKPEENSKQKVYRRRRKQQQNHSYHGDGKDTSDCNLDKSRDSCHNDSDGSTTELNHCLDLFT